MRSLWVLLFISSSVAAQPYIGLRSFFGYPFDLTKQGYYNTIAGGGGIELGYMLQGRVFPSAHFDMSFVQQPIYSDYFNDVSGEATYKIYGLSLNYTVLEQDHKRLLLYGGINAVGIKVNSVSVQSYSLNTRLQLLSDGNNYLYPGVHFGFRYAGSLKVKNLYWTADAYVGYIRVFDSNNYMLTGTNFYDEVTIKGDVLYPRFMIGLQYMFGQPAK